MPRLPRIAFADGVYHITNRGLERRNIVADDQDRRAWLRLLDRISRRYGWRVFAYVLLDNHFHLFLRTPQPNLSEGMHDFESGYVTLFNRRHGRTGPLFQGRFKAIAVEREGHAWELSRYVHLNPVRAKIVASPAAHVWSSYQFYLNPQGAPAWLDWQTVLAEIGGTEAAARIAYRRFVEAAIATPPENPLADAVDGWIVGRAAFVERCRRELANGIEKQEVSAPVSIDEILQAVATVFEVEVAQLHEPRRHNNQARASAVLLSQELTPLTLEAIAQRFGTSSESAISETCKRARRWEQEDEAYQSRMNELRRRLRRE